MGVIDVSVFGWKTQKLTIRPIQKETTFTLKTTNKTLTSAHWFDLRLQRRPNDDKVLVYFGLLSPAHLIECKWHRCDLPCTFPNRFETFPILTMFPVVRFCGVDEKEIPNACFTYFVFLNPYFAADTTILHIDTTCSFLFSFFLVNRQWKMIPTYHCREQKKTRNF